MMEEDSPAIDKEDISVPTPDNRGVVCQTTSDASKPGGKNWTVVPCTDVASGTSHTRVGPRQQALVDNGMPPRTPALAQSTSCILPNGRVDAEEPEGDPKSTSLRNSLVAPGLQEARRAHMTLMTYLENQGKDVCTIRQIAVLGAVGERLETAGNSHLA